MNRIEKIQEFDYTQVCDDIRATSQETSIYVGCDSAEMRRDHTRFVTVVVLHKDSNRGGRCHYECVHEYRIMPLRERLLKEVYQSVTTALMISEACEERTLEVHVDINENLEYASSVVLREAKGYVTGQGFVVRTKPESFAATAIADYMVHNA